MGGPIKKDERLLIMGRALMAKFRADKKKKKKKDKRGQPTSMMGIRG